MNELTWNCTSLWLQREHVITAFMVENAVIKDASQGPFQTFSAWDFMKPSPFPEAPTAGDGPWILLSPGQKGRREGLSNLCD